MDAGTREGKALAQMTTAHISENTATLPLNMQQFLLSLRESIMQNYLEQLKKLMIQTAEVSVATCQIFTTLTVSSPTTRTKTARTAPRSPV